MTDETRILRTVGIPLTIAFVVLFMVPKMCSKAVVAVKQRQEKARAANGLHIQSSEKPVTYPAGLDAERIRYLVEVDTQFATPFTGRIRKSAPVVPLEREQTLLAALQKLGYVTVGPDNTATITRDGLLHLDGLVEDETSWTFPLAKREFQSVTSIDGDSSNAHVGFAWQWKPTTAGAELIPTPRRHDANAELTNGTGRWTLLQITDLDSLPE